MIERILDFVVLLGLVSVGISIFMFQECLRRIRKILDNIGKEKEDVR